MSHPLRARLYKALQGRVASPRMLATEIGVPLGNVAYHVRRLDDLGLIKLVNVTRARGALEHHYTAL
jgi:hypothetical protein